MDGIIIYVWIWAMAFCFWRDLVFLGGMSEGHLVWGDLVFGWMRKGHLC
jgi:hypothetical protein